MLLLHPHLLTLLADETHLHFSNSLPKLLCCLSFHFFSGFLNPLLLFLSNKVMLANMVNSFPLV